MTDSGCEQLTEWFFLISVKFLNIYLLFNCLEKTQLVAVVVVSKSIWLSVTR